MSADWMEWHLLLELRRRHGAECYVENLRGAPVALWWAWWPDGCGGWRHAPGKTAVEALAKALGLDEVRDPLVDPRPGDVVMHQELAHQLAFDAPVIAVVVAIKGDDVACDTMDGDIVQDRVEISLDRWRAEAPRSWVLWLGEVEP